MIPIPDFLALFCRLAAAGRPIPLYEDGRVRRDFVYIADVANAIAKSKTVAGIGEMPIDIGSGEYSTIAEAGGLIAQRYRAANRRSQASLGKVTFSTNGRISQGRERCSGGGPGPDSNLGSRLWRLDAQPGPAADCTTRR